ncbi:MAG: hypothetical protein Q8O93_04590 [bacterium]|nr:hypothetical protein [bacterium]
MKVADECVAENSKLDNALKISKISTSPFITCSLTLQLLDNKPCWHSCGRDCPVKKSVHGFLAEVLADDKY